MDQLAGFRVARRSRLMRHAREAALAYLYILPALVITIVFGLYPVFRAFFISLHNWSIVKGAFVGSQNYRTLFSDPNVGKAFQVTVFYVVATVPVTMMISLLLAYLLFRPIRYRALFRTLYFLPYVTSLVPAAMVWQWIFNYQAGVLNYIAGGVSRGLAAVLTVVGSSPGIYIWVALAAVWMLYLLATCRQRTALATRAWCFVGALVLATGLYLMLRPSAHANLVQVMDSFFPVRWLQEPRGILLYLGKQFGYTPPTWLQGPSMALLAVSLVSMWHFTGYDVVIYMAGLYNVPPDLYEAARIDGATEGQVFWKITLPLLSPTTFFLLITSTIGAFRSFTMFYVLTDGGPLRTTTSVTFMIYEQFYNASRWGYASAIAIVLFVCILIMTLINQRLAGNRVIYQ